MKGENKMRDINRIVKLCEVVSEEWETKCPDLRFMQLMCNFMSWLGYDGFYLEDDVFIEKFKEFMKGA